MITSHGNIAYCVGEIEPLKTEENLKKIGILVHGRHVLTQEWEKIVWGEAPKKLGALPMMALVVLNRGVENIGKIVFGTGASERDGLKESEYTKQFLLKNVFSLWQFDLIGDYPHFQTALIYDFQRLIQNIVCEMTSQNTIEEITAAAKLFAEDDISEVIQITCASHAPRCIRDSAIAREKGLIPESQMWSVVRDMTTYIGTSASDVAIMEPPHRGDDPMIKAPINPHQVFPMFYKVPGLEEKTKTLFEIQELIERKIKK